MSVQFFAKAAHADPMNARYAYCVGVAQERAGDVASAIKELRRSITLDPSQPDPYLALARIHETLGQEPRKLATLREYLRFMPQNLMLRSRKLRLGRVEEGRGTGNLTGCRSVSLPRSSNRTCPFRASGFRTDFTNQLTEGARDAHREAATHPIFRTRLRP